ncbi:MAG: ribosome biogenesis GTPase YlqF [Clostridiales Family XIII bacterium]|jgi:ribosome biogenesis GTPase A|nr:ribosome biogenesis GTPase YlqF [Clostridiales Family XIII bacterium]
MIENINWYPGHMKKTRELIAANLRLVGAVVEVCDARIPVSSRNPIIDELTKGKPRIVVLNKADLADERETGAWTARLSGRGADGGREGCGSISAVALNAQSGQGMKKLLAALGGIAASRVGNAAAGSLGVMVVGVPNSGKSSLINRLTGRRAAQTGDRPGVTKGKQWLTLENGMRLLDTPGILWPKFEDPNVGMNLAFCGSIKDEIMDAPTLALELIRTLGELYPSALAERYGLAAARGGEPPADSADGGGAGSEYGSGADSAWDGGTDPALALMEAIAAKRGCILPGKRVDYERAGRMIVGEFREGKLGRVTLEKAGQGSGL